MTTQPIRAWHFVGATLRDGSPVPADGVLLRHDGPVVPCYSGLHASRDPFDALRYAPGPILCLVECGGTIAPHGDPEDKIACSERTIIARMDATPLLRYYARQQALSVVHLWEPPQVVLDYLKGDDSVRESARAAARDAARDAARAAAWDAALAAARAAARDAAWAAAWDAAWAAARAAARDAAWAAARDAAWDAARAAAWDAARDAAWDAAWDAARDAAWAAARDAAWDAARADYAALVREAVRPFDLYETEAAQ